MKLEVGMYARTNLGIEKIISIKSEYNCLICGIQTKKGFIHRETVLKSSYNIIDLIEVGDYVNGRQVYFIKDDELYEECIHGMYQIKDIKEILTKEQYEANMYLVKESE